MAALADQPEHEHVGIAVARQHRHQRRLADARAGKDPHPLPTATGREKVEAAHPEVQPRAEPLAPMRRRRSRQQGIGGGARWQRRAVVERPRERVDHAPDPARARSHALQPAHRRHPRAAADACEFAERQQVDPGLIDRDHLAEQRFGCRGMLVQVVSGLLDQTGVAKTDHAGQPGAEQELAATAPHAPLDLVRSDGIKSLKKRVDPLDSR